MATLGQYNLDEMTAQEVYEVDAIHLLEQSDISRSAEGACAYNSDVGCCAAGIFIQKYKEVMEGNNWYGLVQDFNQSESHFSLIEQLQGIHDSYSVFGWLKHLKNIPKNNPDLNLDNSFLESWKWSDEDQKYYKE